MVRQAVITTIVLGTVGHSYGQYGCPPVFCKEEVVDHKGIINGDTSKGGAAHPHQHDVAHEKKTKGFPCKRNAGLSAAAPKPRIDGNSDAEKRCHNINVTEVRQWHVRGKVCMFQCIGGAGAA